MFHNSTTLHHRPHSHQRMSQRPERQVFFIISAGKALFNVGKKMTMVGFGVGKKAVQSDVVKSVYMPWTTRPGQYVAGKFGEGGKYLKEASASIYEKDNSVLRATWDLTLGPNLKLMKCWWVDNIRDITGGVLNGTKKVIGAPFALAGAVINAPGKALEAASNARQKVWNTLTNPMETLDSIGEKVYNRVTNPIQTAKESWGGIKNMIGNGRDKVANLLKPITNVGMNYKNGIQAYVDAPGKSGASLSGAWEKFKNSPHKARVEIAAYREAVAKAVQAANEPQPATQAAASQ